MISIVMPTYNRGYTIERAIESVRKQSYVDWELIIIDDASTDNTRQLLQKYISPKIHYYVNEVNEGANLSRNRGVEHAKGEFLTFLDSDNYWPNDKLEVQIKMAETHCNQRCFFYGKVKITNGEDVNIYPEVVMSSDELKKKELKGNVVDINTLLIAKDLFLEVNGFMEELPRFQDWELILRLLFCYNVEAIGCNRILSFNFIQKDSISNNQESYVKALGFMMKNYLNRYISAEEMIDHLIGLWRDASSKKGLIADIIKDACEDKPEIFSEMIHRLWMYWKEIHSQYQVIDRQDKVIVRKGEMNDLLYKWHDKNVKNSGETVFLKCFQALGEIQSIAIYGLGKLGKLFYNEVKSLPVTIAYGIDRKSEYFDELEIKRPYDGLNPVDLIVITVLEDAEKIKKDLKQNYDGKILTLKELLQLF